MNQGPRFEISSNADDSVRISFAGMGEVPRGRRQRARFAHRHRVTVGVVKNLDTLAISDEFRLLVNLHARRLGGVRVVASPTWQKLADRLHVGAVETADGAALVVGPPAAVLRHAANETEEFGFVMPVAQITKWWQRAPRWRDDTTLDLWNLGWSPVAIDRLLVATHDATVEFVIGSARPIPTVVTIDEEVAT
jgi:hypothetical protein